MMRRRWERERDMSNGNEKEYLLPAEQKEDVKITKYRVPVTCVYLESRFLTDVICFNITVELGQQRPADKT